MNPIREPDNVQQHIVVLGWLYVVVNAFILALGTFLFLLLSGIGLTIARRRSPLGLVAMPRPAYYSTNTEET